MHHSQGSSLALHHRALVRHHVSVRSDDTTNGHEQAEGTHGTHDVLTESSHDAVRTSTVLQDGEATKENTDTHTNSGAHQETHLELVEVGGAMSLLVLLNRRHGCYLNEGVEEKN